MTEAPSTFDLAALLTPAIADTTFGRADAPWSMLTVTGPDAVDFVQRLCSQDVLRMAEGDVRPAAFLDGKGRLRAVCTLARCADAVAVETAAADAQGVFDLLDRYHIAERLTVERRESWTCAEVVGPNAAALVGVEPGRCAGAGDEGLVVVEQRHGVVWARRHAPSPRLPSRPDAEGAAGLAPLTDDVADLWRIAAGRIRFGVDADASTLALEADLDDHVSTTKGCYTGQEIMARLRTYGHLNRRLVLLQVMSAEPVAAGVELRRRPPDDGVVVGRVTSSAPVSAAEWKLALGVVSKDAWAVGTQLRLAGGAEVRVVGWNG